MTKRFSKKEATQMEQELLRSNILAILSRLLKRQQLSQMQLKRHPLIPKF